MVIVAVERISGFAGVPAEDSRYGSSGGEPCPVLNWARNATVKERVHFVDVIFAVDGRDFSAGAHDETFRECSFAVQVRVGVDVTEPDGVPLPGRIASALGKVAFECGGDARAQTFLVSPAEVVFVQVKVRPVVADACGECVALLEYAVARACG